MVGGHTLYLCRRLGRLIAIIILSLCSIHLLSPTIQGRRLLITDTHASSSSSSNNNPTQIRKEEDNKVVVLGRQMGSRPPRCEGRCRSCGHCEAIQVPTNPQMMMMMTMTSTMMKNSVSNIAYAAMPGDQDQTTTPITSL